MIRCRHPCKRCGDCAVCQKRALSHLPFLSIKILKVKFSCREMMKDVNWHSDGIVQLKLSSAQ